MATITKDGVRDGTDETTDETGIIDFPRYASIEGFYVGSWEAQSSAAMGLCRTELKDRSEAADERLRAFLSDPSQIIIANFFETDYAKAEAELKKYAKAIKTFASSELLQNAWLYSTRESWLCIPENNDKFETGMVIVPSKADSSIYEAVWIADDPRFPKDCVNLPETPTEINPLDDLHFELTDMKGVMNYTISNGKVVEELRIPMLCHQCFLFSHETVTPKKQKGCPGIRPYYVVQRFCSSELGSQADPDAVKWKFNDYKRSSCHVNHIRDKGTRIGMFYKWWLRLRYFRAVSAVFLFAQQRIFARALKSRDLGFEEYNDLCTSNQVSPAGKRLVVEDFERWVELRNTFTQRVPLPLEMHIGLCDFIRTLQDMLILAKTSGIHVMILMAKVWQCTGADEENKKSLALGDAAKCVLPQDYDFVDPCDSMNIFGDHMPNSRPQDVYLIDILAWEKTIGFKSNHLPNCFDPSQDEMFIRRRCEEGDPQILPSTDLTDSSDSNDLTDLGISTATGDVDGFEASIISDEGAGDDAIPSGATMDLEDIANTSEI